MLDLELVDPNEVIHGGDGRLVDLIDGLLDHGVVIRGEIWLTVADVELVFLGIDLVLSSPLRMQRPVR